MKIRFTRTARADLLGAVAFIARDDRTAAVRFRQRAEQVLQRLEQFPESGRTVPEFSDLPYREVIVPPYRFFCRVVGEIVWIVAVRHGAQLSDEPSE